MEEHLRYLYPQYLINCVYPYDTVIKSEEYPSILNQQG